MAKNSGVWGIDIGQCAIKAIRCRGDANEGQVVADAFDYIEYPKILTQPEADPAQLVADALATFLSRNSVRGDKVAVSVSGQSGLARFIKLPPVESKKIPDIVKYEARQQIPFALEDVVWDYQQISGGSMEDGFAVETEVGLFAMKRDQVFRALQPLNRARIEVDLVQLAPLAVYNFVAFDRLRVGVEEPADDSPRESVVVLSFGTDTTDLVITNGYRVWQRSVPLGGSHFTKALTKEMKLTFAKAEHLKRNLRQAEDPKAVLQAMRPVFTDLVTELQRSIGYFKSIDRKAKVGRILALGNCMKLPALQKFLTQHLDCEVQPVTRFQSLTGENVVSAPAFKNNILSFGTAYGLALQELGKARLATNLMPKEVVTRRIVREKKPWAVAAVAIVLLGCMINYYGYWRSWSTTRIDRYQQAFSEVSQVTSKANEFDTAYKTEQELLNVTIQKGSRVVGDVERRLYWLELIKALHACVPKEENAAPTTDAAEISKREQIFITQFKNEKFTELGDWWADMQVDQPRGYKPSPPGSGGYGYGGDEGGYGGGYGAAGMGMGGGYGGADAGFGGYGADPYADPLADPAATDTGLEGVSVGPSGEGVVIEIHGHHYHNGDPGDEGAEFLKRTIIANLNGDNNIQVELPVPGTEDPATGQAVLESWSIPELGISHAGIKYRFGPIEYKIPDPTWSPNQELTNANGDANVNPETGSNTANTSRSRGYGEGGYGSAGYLEPPTIDLKRLDFVIQFAWVPRTRSERLELRRQREEEARAAAEAGTLEAPAGDGTDSPPAEQFDVEPLDNAAALSGPAASTGG